MTVVRGGICGLIALEVLAVGGVLPSAEAVLELGAAALFLLWGFLAIRRNQAEIHWNWLYLPLLGFCGLAFVQYVFGLTAYSFLTKTELLRWGAYVLVFFLILESFQTKAEAYGFVSFLVLLGFFVSLFGIIQYFTFNRQLYWSIPLPPTASPFGPYVNRDHFAGFVELIAPLGLALFFFRAVEREKLPLLLLLTIVPIGALTLSASRGGIISVLFESSLLLFLSRARHVRKSQLIVDVALVLIAASFILWLGVSEAIQRFGQLTPGELSLNRRVSLYRDTWQIFIHHPWVGTGLGTLVAAYPEVESFYDGTIVDHAHNDYIELLADTGVIGGACGLAFCVLLFWHGLTRVHSGHQLVKAIYAGSLTACAGLLLHSLVDFNLHIPANALIFIALSAIATSNLASLPPDAEGLLSSDSAS